MSMGQLFRKLDSQEGDVSDGEQGKTQEILNADGKRENCPPFDSI
jgi:hypothetical protein